MTDILEAIREKEAQVAELENQLEALRGDLGTLKRAAEIMHIKAAPDRPGSPAPDPVTAVEAIPKAKSRFGPKWAVSIGDASEQILKDGPLHLDRIHELLLQQGLQPTLASLDSALRKDSKARFVLTAKRTYGLRRRAIESNNGEK